MFRIPSDYHEGLRQLVALGDDQIAELSKALAGIPPSFTYLKTAQTLEGQLKLPYAQLSAITEALFATAVVMASSEQEPKGFVEELLESVRSQVKEVDPSNLAAARERLEHLFSIEWLSTIAKAKLIISEHQHSLCSARLFTDIRPIFDEAPEDGPKAAMLVHTLKLAYHQAGELEEFFVAMDVDDLDALITTLERAKKKAESLKKFVSATSVRYLDVEN